MRSNPTSLVFSSISGVTKLVRATITGFFISTGRLRLREYLALSPCAIFDGLLQRDSSDKELPEPCLCRVGLLQLSRSTFLSSVSSFNIYSQASYPSHMGILRSRITISYPYKTPFFACFLISWKASCPLSTEVTSNSVFFKMALRI